MQAPAPAPPSEQYLDWTPPSPTNFSDISATSTTTPTSTAMTMSSSAGPLPGGLSKPFNLADVARAALASPRRSVTLEPASASSSRLPPGWADQDFNQSYDDDDDSDDESVIDAHLSSFASSPASTAPSSPWSSQPSSCAITPSSSSEGFTRSTSIPYPHHPTSVFPSSPTTATTSVLPPPSPTRSPTSHTTRLLRPLPSLPSPPPLPQPTTWSPSSFSLTLLFTSAQSSSPSLETNTAAEDLTFPPAFFPSAIIAFAPRLRIIDPAGLPYSTLGGMHLGVTGMCETLDPTTGEVKSKRLVADFCTDLSGALSIWKRDGETARRANGEEDSDQEPETLPMGTYVLPLTMKIPNSDRLPPSFESPHFRITYTMSIALFSSALTSDGTPLRLKVFSVPFHVLPSTLPTPSPTLPVLTHDHKKSVFASLIKSFSTNFITSSSSSSSSSTGGSSRSKEEGYHYVFPSLPTSHFSPASHASIPVTLRIVDRPLEPTDLYIRLALVRKTYVRESTSSSLAQAIEDEWGLGLGVNPQSLGYSEEVILEPWCVAEEEVVSRWGWVPYSSRPGADPMEKGEVVIRDIGLPLHSLEAGLESTWSHGYSTSLDLDPTASPSQAHGDCSWFSPAFRTRPPVAKEYERHLHVSNQFFLSVQVGFADPKLRDTLGELGAANPDLELAGPNRFTKPSAPKWSKYTGASLTNPFPNRPNSSSSSSSSSSPSSSSSHRAPLASSYVAPSFPGKLRELSIPLTLGSVAEPSMSCIAAREESSAQRRDREEREERGEEVRRTEGEGPEGAWMCAPPGYEEAVKSVPAYVGTL